MFVVVSYDISNDRRRTKVMKAVAGFGERVQYSVFECRLRRRDLERLQERLTTLIEAEEDDVRLYLLCEQCLPRIITMGRAQVTPQVDYRIVG